MKLRFWTLGAIALLICFFSTTVQAQQAFSGYSLKQLETEMGEAKVFQALGYAQTAADGARGCYQYSDEARRQRQILIDLKNRYDNRADDEYFRLKALAEEQFRLARNGYEDCFAATLADYSVLSYAGVRTRSDFKTKVVQLNKKFSNKGDIGAYIAAIEDAIEASSQQLGKRVGVVESAFKRVQVLRPVQSHDWIALEKGMPVYTGDDLRTGPRGRVRIKFDDYLQTGTAGPTVVNIGSSSHIKIEKFIVSFTSPPKHEGVLGVLRGSIRAVTENWGPRSNFSLRAGVTVCGIRGTEVAVSYDPEKDLAVHTLNHGDAFVEANGKRVQLQPRTSITANGSDLGSLTNVSDAAWSDLESFTSGDIAGPELPLTDAELDNSLRSITENAFQRRRITARRTAMKYVETSQSGDVFGTLALLSGKARKDLENQLQSKTLKEIVAGQGEIEKMAFNCAACGAESAQDQECLVQVTIDLAGRGSPFLALFGVNFPRVSPDLATVNLSVPATGASLQRYEQYGPVCAETDAWSASLGPTELTLK